MHPQPITDDVLRAAGFAPYTTFDGDWVRPVSNEIVAFYCTIDGALSWFRQSQTQEGLTRRDRVDLIENVRTPDRLQEVMRGLRMLYAPEASRPCGRSRGQAAG